MTWLYSAARGALRRALDFYFLEVQVAGAIPTEGPVLVACNHPNSIMDTVVLGALTDRPIHFLARSGLFANPLVGAMLRSAGAIPVHRRQDGPVDPAGNQSAFREAFDVLADGGLIGIFPEGQNAPIRHVRAIKTGVARIALEAEAARGWSLGVRVVPVGLNYEERDRFLSRVLVRVGEPIEVGSLREAFETDPRGAVRALTDQVQESMRALAVHVHDEAHTSLLGAIDALIGEELHASLVGQVDLRTLDEKLLRRLSARHGPHEDLDGRFQVRQWIADAIAYYEREQPAMVEALRRQIDRYHVHLRQLRLREDFAERPARTLSARREAIKLTLYALLLAPIALWGLVHNFIPFRLTRRFARRAPEEAIVAIRGLLGGALIFGAFYALYGALVWAGTRSWIAVALYLTSLPIAGTWFLRYRQRLGKFAGRMLLRTLFRTRRRLLRALLLEREQLLVRLQTLEREYRALRASAPDGSSATC